jgi:ubiquinone/menaquinone biosynthesis C-methylase UbiE
MIVFRLIAQFLAATCHLLADAFGRLSNFFYNVLPVLCPASTLTSMVRQYYAGMYSAAQVARVGIPEDGLLEEWEIEVLDRYHLRSGRMLILGSGLGRESFQIAARGVWVLGVDADPNAVRYAGRMAQQAKSQVCFVQADFLELPFARTAFEYILISNSMYSAVPGVVVRQNWLRTLSRLLTPEGLLIISFTPEWHSVSRLKTLCTALNRMLAKLPGSSLNYQRGDEAYNGHFLHAFQDEHELWGELVAAGSVIRQLNWHEHYAVVSFEPPPPRLSVSGAVGAFGANRYAPRVPVTPRQD